MIKKKLMINTPVFFLSFAFFLSNQTFAFQTDLEKETAPSPATAPEFSATLPETTLSLKKTLAKMKEVDQSLRREELGLSQRIQHAYEIWNQRRVLQPEQGLSKIDPSRLITYFPYFKERKDHLKLVGILKLTQMVETDKTMAYVMKIDSRGHYLNKKVPLYFLDPDEGYAKVVHPEKIVDKTKKTLPSKQGSSKIDLRRVAQATFLRELDEQEQGEEDAWEAYGESGNESEDF